MKDPLVGIAKFRSELLFCPEPSPPAAFPILLVGNSILPLLLNQNIGIILDSCFFFPLIPCIQSARESFYLYLQNIYSILSLLIFLLSPSWFVSPLSLDWITEKAYWTDLVFSTLVHSNLFSKQLSQWLMPLIHRSSLLINLNWLTEVSQTFWVAENLFLRQAFLPNFRVF